MAANHGTLREEEMVYHLNQRKIKDLNSNLYCWLNLQDDIDFMARRYGH